MNIQIEGLTDEIVSGIGRALAVHETLILDAVVQGASRDAMTPALDCQRAAKEWLESVAVLARPCYARLGGVHIKGVEMIRIDRNDKYVVA